MKTVVGLYNSVAKATEVKAILGAEGYHDVTVIDQNSESYRTGDESTNPDHNTVGGKIKHFFSSLTGSDDTTHEHYTQGVNRGGALVAVNVDDDRADAAADLLQRHGAQDIQGDAGTYGTTGTTGTGYGTTGYGTGTDAAVGTGVGTGQGVYDAGDRKFGTGTGTLFGSNTGPGTTAAVDGTVPAYTNSTDYGTTGDVNRTNYGDAPRTGYTDTPGADYADTNRTGFTDRANVTGEQVIPVVKEELQIGKREVERGGVRVFSRVVSQPVSETVNLHEERVVVDRRPVDRPATEADFNPETRTVEVTAVGEEAMVNKTGRVVEEVVVGKEATDRTQKFDDTVRHTEVDVQPVGTDTTTTRDTTSKY